MWNILKYWSLAVAIVIIAWTYFAFVAEKPLTVCTVNGKDFTIIEAY